MFDNNTVAGSGLRTMFRAEILAIAGAIFTVIPIFGILGAVAVLVGGIMSLVGLHSAGPTHPKFKTAMIFTIASIAMELVQNFFPEDSLIYGVILFASSVVSFVSLYCVCTAASELVEAHGDYELAQKGRFVWKLALVCDIVVALCVVIMWVPVLIGLAAVAALGTLAATFVAGLLYLVFLNNASNYLLR